MTRIPNFTPYTFARRRQEYDISCEVTEEQEDDPSPLQPWEEMQEEITFPTWKYTQGESPVLKQWQRALTSVVPV